MSEIPEFSLEAHSDGEMKPCPRPLVISGPSGGGKSTILKKLFAAYPGCFAFSVSHYYFVEREIMDRGIKNGDFLEYTEFSGNIYGTSMRVVEEIQGTGKICVLDVDLPGVRSIRASKLNHNDLTRPKYVFVEPPDMITLEERLRGRGTEDETSIQKRLDRAKQDKQQVEAEKNLFDVVIVNDDLDIAYQQLLDQLQEELSKVTS